MSTIEYLPPGDPATLLTADRRLREIESLELAPLDVLVIGGGITGVGIALDAGSRGLSVALVEKDDLAFGTSRWSSKLVHGGLRYLAKGDVAVAWESAAERAVIAGRVAPHLIRPMPQVVPSFAHDRTPARLAWLGMRAGDVMRMAARTPRGLLPGTRHIHADRAIDLVPGIRREGLVGATLGWDCQLEDDARLVVAVARTAAAYGARILTRVKAESIDHQAGIVELTDELTGARLSARAKWIVNATGVWAGDLDPEITVQPSLGTHVIVPSHLLGNPTASLTVPVPGHVGRFVFTLPKGDGLTFIGITDNEMPDHGPEIPEPPVADINWILNVASAALQRPLTADDAVGAFAGVRPLVKAAAGSSADISRRHLIKRTDRLITITGGKLTTYRRMAADVVDELTDHPCRTKDLALVGAGPRVDRPEIPEHLWRRYGNEAADVWDLGMDDPSLRLPLEPDHETLGVEVVFARSAELALTLADVIERRTRISLVWAHEDAARAARALWEGSQPVGA